MRDRLIELLQKVRFDNSEKEATIEEQIADHLINNGLTIRERGEWAYVEYSMGHHVGKCTICDCEADMTNFCPNCGADMRGENNA